MSVYGFFARSLPVLQCQVFVFLLEAASCGTEKRSPELQAHVADAALIESAESVVPVGHSRLCGARYQERDVDEHANI